MKKWVSLLILIAAAACQPATNQDNNQDKEAAFPRADTFVYPIREQAVFGVSIRDFQPQKAYRGYAVQLSLNGHTWVDSVYVEFSGQDTLTTEVIFTEAIVDDTSELDFRVTPFDAR